MLNFRNIKLLVFILLNFSEIFLQNIYYFFCTIIDESFKNKIEFLRNCFLDIKNIGILRNFFITIS